MISSLCHSHLFTLRTVNALLYLIRFVLNISYIFSIDSSEIPSLWEMQSSLLNDSSEDVLVPLCQSLLISALEDPGCEGPHVSTNFGWA